MTAARRLAAILAADVGVREHRDGTSENRANGCFLQGDHQCSHARRLVQGNGPQVRRHRWLEPSCYSDPLKYERSVIRERGSMAGSRILDSRLAPSIATNSVFDRLRRRTTLGFHRPIQTK